uniref:Protein SPT2 n=1 Tax=Anthurium amnicola TaxID=1678845 RepID=A0A1D1XPW0_9ARAE
MLAHGRYSPHQSYDAYNDYEVDEDDREEEDDLQEEDEEPTKEVLEFLKLREQFKEKIRQKYRKENAALLGPTRSLVKNGPTTDTKFGSFFGPSQRVIAPRVIEESKSIREAKHIVSRAPSSTSSGKRVSSNAEVKSSSNSKPHKVVNEIKRKVQTLKETRDYSFLLSDDTELPARTDSASKDVSVPKADARSGQSLPPPKMSMSNPGKQVPGSHLSKNSISRDHHMQKKAEYQKTAPPGRPKASTIEPRKLTNGKVGSGHSQPLVAKASSQGAAQVTVTMKPPAVGTKKPSNMERAPLSTKPHSVAQNNYSQQRREIQDVSKGKLLSKQTSSSSKPQPSKPSVQTPRRSGHEERPKQKPVKSHLRNPFDDDDDDIDDPMSFLRNKLLSRFNSSKYQVDDDDDSDMEANFDEIMKEERRSLKIARQEDEEQLLLIEEEERRERMRREAKKQKLVRR